jgi:hypothetical protein
MTTPGIMISMAVTEILIDDCRRRTEFVDHLEVETKATLLLVILVFTSAFTTFLDFK